MPGVLVPRVKVWLEADGEAAVGDGLAALMEGVAELGSLSAAARRLGMSYRQAWGRVKKSERLLGVTLLETRRGGPEGGGARLTSAGEGVLTAFREVQRQAREAARRALPASF